MSQTSIRLMALLLTASVGLSACEVGPNYRKPEVTTPPAFKEAQGWTPAVPADGVDRGDWWTLFDDPVLNGLEARVEVNNQTLKADIAAYDAARALVAEDRAALFPTVSLTGAGAHSGANSSATNPGHASSSDSYQASLGASWAPDIWGKLRRTVEGAKATAQATEADLIDARLSAQSELAADYIQLRLADANTDLLQRTVDAYQRTLKITQNQYSQGVASQSDVQSALSQLASAQASLIAQRSSRAQAEHAIALLVGVPPADLTIAVQADWRPKPPPTPEALPSTLLQRRPDVAAAERTAAAASAQIGVQESAYFPDLTLSGSYGYSAGALGALFNSSNALWSYGGNVAQTVFNAGATSAAVRGAKATYAEQVANYRQTVLTAFQQVEDALVAAQVLQNEEVYTRAASDAADRAAKITLNEYQAGTIAFTGVVTAQATALSAREALLSLQGQRVTNSISLIEALGGGWSGVLK